MTNKINRTNTNRPFLKQSSGDYPSKRIDDISSPTNLSSNDDEIICKFLNNDLTLLAIWPKHKVNALLEMIDYWGDDSVDIEKLTFMREQISSLRCLVHFKHDRDHRLSPDEWHALLMPALAICRGDNIYYYVTAD